MKNKNKFEINERGYGWWLKSIKLLESKLRLNINVHSDDKLLQDGQIFLFNHFARFETVIPPYIIYRATGSYCRSISDKALFNVNDRLTKLLTSGGAVPNNLPGLLPFLAAEILRGRKVIVFPEGGMIKDRRVMDDEGQFRIFSPTSGTYREHHRGAAVLALTLDLFKRRIKDLFEDGDEVRISHWCESLGIESKEELLKQANKPTQIVPTTITFNPIRISDNILSRAVELFAKKVPDQLAEELAVEGNLLFKETDMDIRLGDPIQDERKWHFLEKMLLKRYFLTIDSLDELFSLKDSAESFSEKLMAQFISKESLRVRDKYMEELYSGITINIGHIASQLMTILAEREEMEISKQDFHRAIYLTIKSLQNEPGVFLHDNFLDPKNYRGMLKGKIPHPFKRFLKLCVDTGLLVIHDDSYTLLNKISIDHTLHEVRLENPVRMYSNEVEPIPQVKEAILASLEKVKTVREKDLAVYLFDDELHDIDFQKKRFNGEKFKRINEAETATADSRPYMLLPNKPAKTAVLLVHGFFASPAELKAYGEELHEKGYAVLGMRLAGHGTSPWDLHERTWQDLLESVRRNYNILSHFADNVVVIGFSTGAALSLLLAGEQPKKLGGLVSIAAPIALKDPMFPFTKALHKVNTLFSYLPSLDGIYLFRRNRTAAPSINYRTMPMRGVYQLALLLDFFKTRLGNVTTKTLILQGDQDHIVEAHSAKTIFDAIHSTDKKLHLIESERHNILQENEGNCHDLILSFIKEVEEGAEENA